MRRADVLAMSKVVNMARLALGMGRPQDAVLIALCGGLGLRVGDALSLRWGKIIDEDGNIRDPIVLTEKKNRSTRIVSLLPWAADIMLQYYRSLPKKPDPNDFIVPYRDRKYAWERIKKIANAIGLQGVISPHSLRKSFCTLVYENTRDPVLTARITGHKNPAQLLVYIGKRPESEEEVWKRLMALRF